MTMLACPCPGFLFSHQIEAWKYVILLCKMLLSYIYFTATYTYLELSMKPNCAISIKDELNISLHIDWKAYLFTYIFLIIKCVIGLEWIPWFLDRCEDIFEGTFQNYGGSIWQ